jgi:hypothetical protein
MILKENPERNTTSSSIAGSRGNSLPQVLYNPFFLAVLPCSKSAGQSFKTLLLRYRLIRCHRLICCHRPTFRHSHLRHPREIKKVVPPFITGVHNPPITHDRLIRCQYPVFCHCPTCRHYHLNHPREINQEGSSLSSPRYR